MSVEKNNGYPALPPLLDEFRAALLDEIEVAKRNSSSSAVPLNGCLVTLRCQVPLENLLPNPS